MKVKKLNKNAEIPTKAHVGDLGYDLYASRSVSIAPGDTVLIPTGIAIQFPSGYGGLIRDRSSVATKKALFTVAGVIDNGYIGEISVAMYNSSPIEQQFFAGDKIAQLVLIPTVNFNIEVVEELQSADDRGSNGFGSTGV